MPPLYPALGPSWLCPSKLFTPLSVIPLTLQRSCILEQEGLEHVLGSGWGTRHDSLRKLTRVLGSLNLLPPPCFGNKQVCVCSSQAESKFLSALLSVLQVFKSAKEDSSSWCCTLELGHPIRGLYYLLPKEDLKTHVILLLFCVPSQWVLVLT